MEHVQLRYWKVARTTYRELLEEMERWRQEKAARTESVARYVCFCDAMGLAKGWSMPELQQAYREADAVLADGAATKLLAQISGKALPERVIGPYLFPAAIEYGIKLGWRHFFYGTNQATLERLKASMEAKYPGVKIVGMYAPEYAPDPAVPKEAPECDFFWIGLGNPKQEIWCHRHAKEINAACLMPVGAVFDFYSGVVPQTPDWVHKIGCCWLWRMITGGKRTFKRDAYCVPRALWILVCEWWRRRRG